MADDDPLRDGRILDDVELQADAGAKRNGTATRISKTESEPLQRRRKHRRFAGNDVEAE